MRPLLLLLLGATVAAAPFTLEVSVVDESGVPLPGAAVFAETMPAPSSDPWNTPSRRVRVESTADARGVARLMGRHGLATLVVGATAPGFHPALRQLALGDPSARLVLPRRLGVSGSARYTSLTHVLPDDGAEHGFDLLMGAFTEPLGVGRHADVWIRGRCQSASPSRASGATAVDEVEMRFAQAGDGVAAVPRPGQPGFAAAIAPACADMLLPDLSFPRLAPHEGYLGRLVYRAVSSGGSAAAHANAPQWILRVTRENGVVHGVLVDFGWVEGGLLRVECRVGLEADNPLLEFGP